MSHNVSSITRVCTNITAHRRQRHLVRNTLAMTMLLLLVWSGVWGALPSPVLAQDKEITVEQRNCDVTILPNGDVQVVETWNVRFQKGRFSRVMHDISHEHITGVTGWEVRESGVQYRESPNDDPINYEPETYTIRTGEKTTTITWYFPKTQNSSRTFILKYTLQGALRVYPGGNDIFSWAAVERNHAYPITESQVVVHLPGAYDPSVVQGVSYRNQQQEPVQPRIDEQTVTFTGGSFDPGTSWNIRVQFPHGAVEAQRPPWQTDAEHALSDPTNAAVVERRDYDLTVVPDGDVQVVETWELAMSGGPFRNASFDLPHTRLTGVDGWSVSEQGQVYQQTSTQDEHTFNVVTDTEHSRMTWYFPVTTHQTRIFTIGYMVHGGVWIAPDSDQLFWQVSQADRSYVVNASRVVVHLPAVGDPNQIHASVACEHGKAETTVEQQGNEVTVNGGPFDPGVACLLNVQFPHGSVTAAAPPWQMVADEQQQQADQAAQQQSFYGLLKIVGVGIVAVVLLIGLVLFWRKLPG